MGGYDKERDLVREVREAGYGAMKTPRSGSGTSAPLPDVLLCGSDYNLFACELKYTQGDVTNFDRDDDILPLKRFSEKWDATPILLSRYAYDRNWYVVEVSEDSSRYSEMLTRTGNIRPRKEDADDYERLFELLENEPKPLTA